MSLKRNFRFWMFRVWYWYVNKTDKDAAILFMNFGYFDTGQIIKLDAHDESNRYSVQLYHHLASTVDITNKDICEIVNANIKTVSFKYSGYNSYFKVFYEQFILPFQIKKNHRLSLQVQTIR